MSEICQDINKPTVNEDALECCSLTPFNCVVASEYNSFFKIGVGKTLTYAIKQIEKIVKKNKTDIEEIQADHAYREYDALLTQVDINAPTAIVNKNDLPATPVYTYDGSGDYSLVLLGAFPVGKTHIFLGTANLDWDARVKAYRVDDDTIRIQSGDSGAFVDNDVITNLPLRVVIYD